MGGDGMRRGGLYGLFFLSGACALAYELAWQRLLHLVFGVSTLAVSAVLAAFMGGLALGGLLCGRLADRARRPLRLYALIEAAVGVSALLVPPGFALLSRAYTALYAALEPGPWGGACLRFGLALLALGVPATFLGATVPVMVRLAWHRGLRVQRIFSIVYGVNTLGAVTGAALTGLVFLRLLGMRQTLLVGVGLNLFVALSAWWLSRRGTGGEPEGAPAPGPGEGRGGWAALACAGLTGAAGMGFEVAWSRVLGVLTSNSAFGFALLLSVLLSGLGAGGLLQFAWSRRPGDGRVRLALCQVGLAAVTLGSMPLFRSAP